jgi:hypothetical protein
MTRRFGLVERYGQWAVVTGASEGIGKAFASGLARRRFNLVLVARRRQKLEELARELQLAHACDTRVFELDLARPEAPAALDELTRPLDVGLLVAAAGYGTSGPLLHADAATELDMIDLNCRSVLAQSMIFGRRFAERGGGGLILMSSLVGWQGAPNAANYAATKAYVQALAEGLGIEMSPAKIDVLAVAPGPVHSGFAARAGMRMTLAATPQVVAERSLTKLGRQGTAVPGFVSKFLTYSLSSLPRRARVRMMGRIMEGMIRHRYGKTSEEAQESA